MNTQGDRCTEQVKMEKVIRVKPEFGGNNNALSDAAAESSLTSKGDLNSVGIQ